MDTNKNYVEREELSLQLEKLFSVGHQDAISPKRIVLCGLSGSGKTETAVRFAERHRKDYFAVFWINAINETRLHDDFEGIARVLDLGHCAGSEILFSQAQKWLKTHSRWLLIIDNLNDEKTMDLLQRKYINAGMKGDILITSNNNSAAARWKPLKVSDMQPYEAKALVRNITGPEISEGPQISELLDDLGHLPLAVDQAASYMFATEISAARYRKLFAAEKCRLLHCYPSTQYNQDKRHSVMTTWEISFKRIQEDHPQGSRLFLPSIL